MRSFGTKLLITIFIVLSSVATHAAEKKVYIPSSFGSMDLNNNASQWSYQRSIQTDNFILFWEAGYGANPSTVSNSSYRVNLSSLLNIAERSFAFYRDSLKFVIEGQSRTDSLKMIILLYYTTDWMASGSGIDNMIGQLNLSANAAQAGGETVAHEVGHCFQYQVHCDGHPGGWMYGFGSGGAGGNGWWEQCAQWQAFKVLPHEQFSNYQFGNYLNSYHKHILHEAPRYANYFIQDYWSDLHGKQFIAKLWQESVFPEDPVQTYKRLTNISQEEFNDEMYDCAAKFVTWDVDAIRREGFDYIDARGSNEYTLTENDFWKISASDCPENFGYNVMRLNIPEAGDTLKMTFEGLSGTSGYRSLRYYTAEWRYGFVVLKEDGRRVYSPMYTSSYDLPNRANPIDSASFVCPEGAKRLWLVVSASPMAYWRHAWDDDDSNDEQWPYQVKFENSNMYGVFNFSDVEVPEAVAIAHDVYQTPSTTTSGTYPSTAVQPNWEQICNAFKLQLNEIKQKFGSQIRYCAIEPSGNLNYTSTANAPGNWFSESGAVVYWGNTSDIFSEFDVNNLAFNIGQYPNHCKVGDSFVIRQGLVYTPTGGSSVVARIEFNVHIVNELAVSTHEVLTQNPRILKSNKVHQTLFLQQNYSLVEIYNLSGQKVITVNNSQQVDIATLSNGHYIVRANGVAERFVKQ